MWRVLKRVVPTRMRLWNKGVLIAPTFCPLYNDLELEGTVDHAFRDCPWSRRVWFASSLGINWEKKIEMDFVTCCAGVIRAAPTEAVEVMVCVTFTKYGKLVMHFVLMISSWLRWRWFLKQLGCCRRTKRPNDGLL